MRELLQRHDHAVVYAVAAVLVLALAAMSGAARGGAMEDDIGPYLPPHLGALVAPGPQRHPVPRWSNQQHYGAALATRAQDCAYGPDYAPGVSAAGDPVIPADLPSRRPAWLPQSIEADIPLRRRAPARHGRGHHAGAGSEIADRGLSVIVAPVVEDCIPPAK